MRTQTLLSVMAAASLWAQNLPDSPAPIQHIQAQLSSALKLSKAKAGDKLKAQTVAAVTLANGTAVPTGATLLGRVLKCDATSVTLSFDQADVDGRKVPLNITLVGAALMSAKVQMSQESGRASIDSPSPDDHPLNGSRRSVTENGSNAASGVSHESLSEVNAGGPPPTAAQGPSIPAHAGAVIGMPGVSLSVDDGPPYASKFELSGKDLQLPRGVQLMFSVR